LLFVDNYVLWFSHPCYTLCILPAYTLYTLCIHSTYTLHTLGVVFKGVY
jgi:hypothetical protein